MELIRILSADWIFPPKNPPIQDGALVFEGGRLVEMGTREEMKNALAGAQELTFKGSALLPGLINCHTHLELTFLDRIPVNNGFAGWLKDLLERKGKLADEDRVEGAERGAMEVFITGCAYVADTASGPLPAISLVSAGIPGTLFWEFLGLGPEAQETFSKSVHAFDEDGMEGVRLLPACHAPYSTSEELFRAVGAWAKEKNCPTMVHLAESVAEVELLASGESELTGFLEGRGISKDQIPVPNKGPVAYLDDLGFLTENTVAVHLVQATDEDFGLLKEKGVWPCLCPSSNLHLTGRLPPVKKMLDAGLRPCLGTDSPASGASLNLFKEMEILLDEGLDADEVLAMGTVNGADALGLSRDFGRLEPDSSPYLVAIPCDPDDGESPLEAAIHAGAKAWARWVISPKSGGIIVTSADDRDEEDA